MPIPEIPIALDEIEKETGFRITAAFLPEIGERRIRIASASGARLTIVLSDEGKCQNAASFTAANGGSLSPEHVIVLDGAMSVITYPDWSGEGRLAAFHYKAGEVAMVDASRPHATHPNAGSCVVGIMAADWKGMKRTARPDVDEAIRKLASAEQS